ncbi:uncharacterized protein [Diabrotica undecimpunctata]|uniref:uncharacterized protein n=1 Tax=Diabrotica undecimpunctata TaxID=50387 RepID=UPI003B63E794
MSRKGFLVKVELDVQRISCPGVWLCSNGKVSLQIHMFGSSVQTRNCRPAFPLIFYEKFVFSKIFDQDRRLNELQRRLNNEWFYAELIQWKSCDEGRVLATFRTTLDELLYPSSFRNSIMGVNVDLLMEPTEIFPGTIAPKLETSSKTTVEETIIDPECDHANVTLINPKAMICKPFSENKGLPRKVCHSVGFSRAQRYVPGKKKKPKPPFKYVKVSDDLILRNNPNVVLKSEEEFKATNKPYCYCMTNSADASGNLITQYADCDCRSEKIHKRTCTVCSLYDGYFSENSANCGSLDRSVKFCQKCRKCQENGKGYYRKSYQESKYHIASKNGSPCNSDTDESERKICLCLPADRTTSLAQQLHERLARTLDTSSRRFHNCIDCT